MVERGDDTAGADGDALVTTASAAPVIAGLG